MGHRPSDAYCELITVRDAATNAAVDAQSITAAIYKNGIVDGTFALTVTGLAVGLYKLTGTVPAGYVRGDVFQAAVTITMEAGGPSFRQECRPHVVEAVSVPQTGDSYLIVSSGVHGNAMLATAAALSTVGSDVTTLTGRLTATRAGYLDNLANVAQTTDVLNISNNTRVRSTIPAFLERPDSGSQLHTMVIELYDGVGNMEGPDSTPTVGLVDDVAGTSLAARLSALSNPSTGRYTFTYNNDSAHALASLRWTVTVVEGGATRTYSYRTELVDTSAVDFTATDRSKLNALSTDYTTARAAKLDFLTGDAYTVVSSGLHGNAALKTSLTTLSSDLQLTYSEAAAASVNSSLIVNRLGAWTGSGLNTVLGAFRALLAKAAGLLPTDLIAGTTYNNTLHSQEAIRESLDAGVVLAASETIYHARVAFTRDQANTRDEYTVRFFRNATRLTVGVTGAQLQVVKRADGADLIAATNLTAIGATGAYKHDATGASRTTVGEAVLVIVTATIDGQTRTWEEVITRDS